MKKRFLLLPAIYLNFILIIGCTSTEIAELPVVENNKTQQRLDEEDGGGGSGSVTTVWTIGRQSRNCFSIGICKLKKVKLKVLSIEATVYGNRMFAGELKKIDSNNFILQVDKENMRDIIKEFGGEYLILEEDFIIDPIDSEELELSNNFTIESGRYDFIKNETNSLYEVLIRN